MLSVKETEKLILDLIQPLNPKIDTEIITLDTALNRILATTITSKIDFPHWDNSAMDGYAVKYEDVQTASQENPIFLPIVEEIPAGYQPKITLQSQQAARIFTGSVLPLGADTIVIQENTKKKDNGVLIFAAPKPQEFVRHRGSFYQAGNPLLPTAILLNPAEIAVLACAQCTQLPVYRRPKVAIFSTGDELVNTDTPLEPGKIVDSNQYALSAFISSQGAIPLSLGIIPDDQKKLAEAIATAITSADIVLSTGGVSVGDYDYIEAILEKLQATIHIRSVAIKPGKPLTVATFPNGCVYFGIPGNPVSALISCWRFVQPALKKLSGLADNWQPKFIKAISGDRLYGDSKRETYLWGKLDLVDGRYRFSSAQGSHSSGNLINLAQTNALAIVPIGQITIEAETEVEVLQIS